VTTATLNGRINVGIPLKEGSDMFRRILFFVVVAIGPAMLTPVRAQADASLLNRQSASADTWKTISLGTFKSSFAMFDALDAAGIEIGDQATEVMHRPAFTISNMKTNTQLVVLSAADLGSGERVPLGEFYARARKLGYELCPPEVVAQLRLQYQDQPVGEFLNIAMEPIPTFTGELTSLSIGNGGAGLMIVGQPMSVQTVPDRATRFVFVRPQQIARP
jgi:hypothetical protein